MFPLPAWDYSTTHGTPLPAPCCLTRLTRLTRILSFPPSDTAPVFAAAASHSALLPRLLLLLLPACGTPAPTPAPMRPGGAGSSPSDAALPGRAPAVAEPKAFAEAEAATPWDSTPKRVMWVVRSALARGSDVGGCWNGESPSACCCSGGCEAAPWDCTPGCALDACRAVDWPAVPANGH